MIHKLSQKENQMSDIKAKIELIHKDNCDMIFTLAQDMYWDTEEDLFGFIKQTKKDFEKSPYEVVVTL